MIPFLQLLAAVFVVVALTGCGPAGRDRPPQETAPGSAAGGADEPSADNTGAEAADAQTFRKLLADRLAKAEAEIAEIAAKVAALPDEARAEWRETVDHLETEAAEMKRKLADLEQSASAALKTVRDEATRAWERLEQAVKRAAAEIRPTAPPEPAAEPAPDMPVAP